MDCYIFESVKFILSCLGKFYNTIRSAPDKKR